MSLVTGNLRAPLKERKEDSTRRRASRLRRCCASSNFRTGCGSQQLGAAAIVNVLRAAGHEVIASDLVDYGDPTHFSRRDFLLERKAPDGCEAIVSESPIPVGQRVRGARAGSVSARRHAAAARLPGERAPSRRSSKTVASRGFTCSRNRLPMMHRDGWQGPKAGNGMASPGSAGTARIPARPTSTESHGAARARHERRARSPPRSSSPAPGRGSSWWRLARWTSTRPPMT